MDAGIAAIDAQPALRLVVRPLGGLVLWIAADDRIDDVDLARAAYERGVAVSPGRPWFCAEPTGTFIRVSLAAADESAIAEGIRRLGAAAAAL